MRHLGSVGGALIVLSLIGLLRAGPMVWSSLGDPPARPKSTKVVVKDSNAKKPRPAVDPAAARVLRVEE